MLGSPDCANNSWLASSAFSSFIRWNKSFTILCSSFRLMKPSLLMSNTLKICFKFSCGVPLDMMYSTIMNSLKLEFPNFDIDTFGIYLEYNTQRWPLLWRCQSIVKVSKLRNIPEVNVAVLVGVIHPEDVPLQLLGVGARVALGHHRVEWLPRYLAVRVLLQEILVLSLQSNLLTANPHYHF